MPGRLPSSELDLGSTPCCDERNRRHAKACIFVPSSELDPTLPDRCSTRARPELDLGSTPCCDEKKSSPRQGLHFCAELRARPDLALSSTRPCPKLDPISTDAATKKIVATPTLANLCRARRSTRAQPKLDKCCHEKIVTPTLANF